MRGIISSIFSAGIERVADLVGPLGCAGCDASVKRRVIFCVVCGESVEKEVKVERGVISLFEYGGVIASAIARFKYRGRSELGKRLGIVMGESVLGMDVDVDVDCVLPVPLHPIRLAERGYNQSLLLARPVARVLEVPILAHSLLRVRHTPRQVTLDRNERRTNLYDAFEFGIRRRAERDVRDARILLIDDVCTTGATIDGCARALIEAGARTVQALVLARAS